MKLFSILVLFGLLAVVTFAQVQEDVNVEQSDLSEVADKGYYPKCPCKCYFHRQTGVARHECKKRIYKHCKVDKCVKKTRYGVKKGLWCCDHKPSVTPTPTPTPTPKPKCPCKCTEKRWAQKDCRYLSPFCKVIACEDKVYRDKHGRVIYSKPEFQCCDYHH